MTAVRGDTEETTIFVFFHTCAWVYILVIMKHIYLQGIGNILRKASSILSSVYSGLYEIVLVMQSLRPLMEKKK